MASAESRSAEAAQRHAEEVRVIKELHKTEVQEMQDLLAEAEAVIDEQILAQAESGMFSDLLADQGSAEPTAVPSSPTEATAGISSGAQRAVAESIVVAPHDIAVAEPSSPVATCVSTGELPAAAGAAVGAPLDGAGTNPPQVAAAEVRTKALRIVIETSSDAAFYGGFAETPSPLATATAAETSDNAPLYGTALGLSQAAETGIDGAVSAVEAAAEVHRRAATAAATEIAELQDRHDLELFEQREELAEAQAAAAAAIAELRERHEVELSEQRTALAAAQVFTVQTGQHDEPFSTGLSIEHKHHLWLTLAEVHAFCPCKTYLDYH